MGNSIFSSAFTQSPNTDSDNSPKKEADNNHEEQGDNNNKEEPVQEQNEDNNEQQNLAAANEEGEDEWQDADDNDDEEQVEEENDEEIISQEDAYSEEEEPEETKNEASVGELTQKMEYGCSHYRRACLKKCEECKEFFSCRFCHDEIKYMGEKDIKKAHQFNRFATKEVKCLKCEHVQQAQQSCDACSQQFAGYYCDICKLYDDEFLRKKIFHCEKCGICRVGGREFTFHCDGCGCCMGLGLLNNHECKVDRLNEDCAVCMEKLFTSRDGACFLRCGHSMHPQCFRAYQRSNINCPICRKSIVDPRLYEAQMDNLISQQPMPEEFATTEALIMCNDCMKKSTVKYHFVGMKCPDCRSYNTQQITQNLK